MNEKTAIGWSTLLVRLYIPRLLLGRRTTRVPALQLCLGDLLQQLLGERAKKTPRKVQRLEDGARLLGAGHSHPEMCGRVRGGGGGGVREVSSIATCDGDQECLSSSGQTCGINCFIVLTLLGASQSLSVACGAMVLFRDRLSDKQRRWTTCSKQGHMPVPNKI